MFKDESIYSPGSPEPSEAASLEQRGGSGSNSRRRAQGEIGFVGLGHMGTAMAANLASAGRRVIAYVRRADQMGKLVALGLKPTTDITNLFDCEVVISMLPDDDAVRDVVIGRADLGIEGLALGLMPGAIHLSMSTISTATASRLASEHAHHGQGYVAAPVFGNPDAAKLRQLFIVAAGAAADVERCRPLLDNLGQQTFVIGTDPEQGNLIKLLGNMMTATALEMLGEVVAVALKRGLDPKPFIDFLTSTMFGGRVHKIYGDKISKHMYAPGFVLPLVLKDVRLALAEAENAGAPMPSVGVVRDRLITGIARGYAGLDWTALGLIAEEEAGLHAVPSAATDSQTPGADAVLKQS
jgi:3-hydroxyisobutyrate dehydrogenase-like beta-hydroxyacid dehydrogenase